MSFKKTLAFILLVLLVVLITFMIFFFINKAESPEDPDTTLFPLGGENRSGLTRDGITQGNETNILLTNDGSGTSSQTIESKKEQRLRKLYDEPVSGGIISTKTIFVEKETLNKEDSDTPPETTLEEETSYEAVFVDRKNGHLIIDKEYEDNQETLTTTTILQVYKAFLSKNQVILQFLDQTQEVIQTFAGVYRGKQDIAITQPEEDSSGEENSNLILQEKTLEGSILPEGITSISLSPDGSEFLYTLYSGTTEIRRASLLDPTQYQIVHRSPFRDVFIEWTEPSSFFLHSKADSRTEGFVEKISLVTGRATPLESGQRGLLMRQNKEGTISITKTNQNNSLIIRNNLTGTSHTTPFASIPEKCIWANTEEGVLYCGGQEYSPNLPVPEAWYQGNFSYNDHLYKVDLEANTSTKILSPIKDGFPQMDIIPMSLSEDDSRILFQNKITLEPWVFKINSY